MNKEFLQNLREQIKAGTHVLFIVIAFGVGDKINVCTMAHDGARPQPVWVPCLPNTINSVFHNS